MNAISPWAAVALAKLAEKMKQPLYTTNREGIDYTVLLAGDSLWMVTQQDENNRVAFRLACSPSADLSLEKCTALKDGLSVEVTSEIGHFHINLFFNNRAAGARYTTRFTPSMDLLIPFWPRDVLITGKRFRPGKTAGEIHVTQKGARSGLLYVTFPLSGALLYMQNLTALSPYCEQTNTSCQDVVGGRWPELGLALPPTKDKPLIAGRALTISDAIIVFGEHSPVDELQTAEQYLDLLAAAYLQLPMPSTSYHDWPTILDKGLKDLKTAGCWSQVKGNEYLNAYVCDYKTPPEIMVQLAVLLPLIDYGEWLGTELPEVPLIKKSLPEFYNKELKTIMRWLPAAEDSLEDEEEQKKPRVMDAWYLHHPLLNLSRLALKGDKQAKKLFLDSLPYAIKVARHFKYEWPVFYHMESLEVIKAETEPGKGGEKDVAGLYTHVLLQAYELTGMDKYLREAEKAARTLKSKGFNLLYQSNNTAFSAGALLRLHKLTGKKIYLDLSYVCIANLFSNVQLWNCHYGYGKHFPRFFALFPLKDAPYTAVYEEQETFCALHDYVKHSRGVSVSPSVHLLVAEYIRHLVNRAPYYYPPMLPKEMLSDKVKMGEVDPKLWIALEDLYDGWDKAGQVGQEVYGAGNAFGILPRHCFIVKDKRLRIFTDYPVINFREEKNKSVIFRTTGSKELTCRLLILKQGDLKLPDLVVYTGTIKQIVSGRRTKQGDIEYTIRGSQLIKITWKN
jgi:hypothetical protein